MSSGLLAARCARQQGDSAKALVVLVEKCGELWWKNGARCRCAKLSVVK